MEHRREIQPTGLRFNGLNPYKGVMKYYQPKLHMHYFLGSNFLPQIYHRFCSVFLPPEMGSLMIPAINRSC